jgi:hypothetical protein
MKKTFGKVALSLAICGIMFSNSTHVFAETLSTNTNTSTNSVQTLYTSTPTKVDFKSIKEKAIQQNKIFDEKKYNDELKNAKTQEEKQKVIDSFNNYVVYREIVSPNNTSQSATTMQPAVNIGDVSIEYEYVYGGDTTYNYSSTNTLDNALYTAIDIGVGWTHPFTGAFMSVLGLFIPSDDYQTYSGIVLTTLHDYVITRKEAVRWDGSHWDSMATSEQKDTSAQLNAVYYAGSTRETPSNLDLGLVEEDTGEYFNDDSMLESLAKNTTYPLYYAYNTGTTVNYNNDYLLSY